MKIRNQRWKWLLPVVAVAVTVIGCQPSSTKEGKEGLPETVGASGPAEEPNDSEVITAAANAEEALALFAQGAQFALLLSDVMMPGLSGPELAARVDERYGALPTLFISGHTDNARLRSGALPPHQRFLQKPFAPSDLGKALRELLAPAPG